MRLSVTSGLYPSGFKTNILYAFLYPPLVLYALPITYTFTSLI
jgi:hypothetical protein